MTDTGNASQVLAQLEAAIQLALDNGFDADEIIDTVGAMVWALRWRGCRSCTCRTGW